MVEKTRPKRGEPVWTFRGYELKASEFNAAMVHFFRAEVARANAWRQRLDTTTNWAVVTTGAVVSFAFSQTESSHIVILLNLILVTLFLLIEARRYRYYELWSYRVRLMETDFFAAMLVPPFQPSPEWAESLAENLLHPQFPISEWEAVGRRLRRNFLWIYVILGFSWIAKIGLFPVEAGNARVFFERAALGPVSGEWIVVLMALFYIALVAFSLATVGLQRSAGEVLPRFGLGESILGRIGKAGSGIGAWFRPTRRRQQVLTLIITAQPDQVAASILKELKRGVTNISGTGMYTRKPRAILLCALTVTEIPHLKTVVASQDARAFVIVSPVQEVLGAGFVPLK